MGNLFENLENKKGGRRQSEVAERFTARRTSMGWKVWCGVQVGKGVRKNIQNTCGRGDSNPHGYSPLDPEPSASTSSATSANFVKI